MFNSNPIFQNNLKNNFTNGLDNKILEKRFGNILVKLDTNNGDVSILGEWRTNYGIIYPNSIKEFKEEKSGIKKPFPIQVIGMDSDFGTTRKVLDWIYKQILEGKVDHLIEEKESDSFKKGNFTNGLDNSFETPEEIVKKLEKCTKEEIKNILASIHSKEIILQIAKILGGYFPKSTSRKVLEREIIMSGGKPYMSIIQKVLNQQVIESDSSKKNNFTNGLDNSFETPKEKASLKSSSSLESEKELYEKFKEINSELNNKTWEHYLNIMWYSIKNDNFFEAGSVYKDLVRDIQQKKGRRDLENLLFELGDRITKFEYNKNYK